MLLWLLPRAAMFIVSQFSKIIGRLGISYVLLVPVIAVLINLTKKSMGFAVDFAGVRGTIVVFVIYLVLSAISVSVGLVLGMICRRRL